VVDRSTERKEMAEIGKIVLNGNGRKASLKEETREDFVEFLLVGQFH